METRTWAAKIVADTLSPAGARLITAELTIPRIVLPELLTHRRAARNAASTRAIPASKVREALAVSPFVPDLWPAETPGMFPQDALSPEAALDAEKVWRSGLEGARRTFDELCRLGVHREIAARVLEPWQWHTVLFTLTAGPALSNFLALRTASAASRPIRLTALALQDAVAASHPRCVTASTPPLLRHHMPFVVEADVPAMEALLADVLRAERREGPVPITVGALLALVSAARCARVSFQRHRGRPGIAQDLRLALRLLRDGHMSPFEHVARPMTVDDVRVDLLAQGATGGDDVRINPAQHWRGPFQGWVQLRKELPGEEDPAGVGRAALARAVAPFLTLDLDTESAPA